MEGIQVIGAREIEGGGFRPGEQDEFFLVLRVCGICRQRANQGMLQRFGDFLDRVDCGDRGLGGFEERRFNVGKRRRRIGNFLAFDRVSSESPGNLKKIVVKFL